MTTVPGPTRGPTRVDQQRQTRGTRKRPPYRPTDIPTRLTGHFGNGWPAGEYWAAEGNVINQYSADGEIACFGALSRGLKRRYGAHRVLLCVIVALLLLVFLVGL